MKPFNLAESKIEERNLCRREVSRRFRVIWILLVLDVAAFVAFVWCRVAFAGRSASIESELANVQGRCMSLKKELAIFKSRSAQREWHATLAGQSRQKLSMLDSILCSVPEGAWLTRVESSESNNAILVDGGAFSVDSVSEFMRTLEALPHFSDVYLNSTQAASSEAHTLSKGSADYRYERNRPRDEEDVIIFSLQVRAKLAQQVNPGSAQITASVPKVQESP
ncbi:MAG: PilN domain-containing protein [Armatimonadota bacterium]